MVVAAAATLIVVVLVSNASPTALRPSLSPAPTLLSAQPAPSSPEPASAPPQPTLSPIRADAWTGLRWSQPNPIPERASFRDIVAWHDGYVAVGSASGPDTDVGAAFISADGATWERTTAASVFSGIPGRVMASPTRLLAFGVGTPTAGSLEAWSSLDGRIWRREASLALADAGVIGVAARGTTIVAVGMDATGRATMWRSVAAGTWTKAQTLSPRAIVRGVVAISDGFIATGREGDPDTGSGGVGVRGVGRPAAWWSSDGGVWGSLQVEGAEAAGAELDGIYPVADGYFAIGSDTTTAGQSTRSAVLWLSTDGHAWRQLGPPPHWGMAGTNSQQAVVLAYGGATANPEGWLSMDGHEWTPLVFAGDLGEVPVVQQFLGMSGHIDEIFVMPHGVIVIGQLVSQQSSRPAAWFATAIIR